MQRWFVVFCSVMLITACQPLLINTQADPYADFSGYQRFDWLPEKQQVGGDRVLLLVQQLKFTVERELKAKGVVKSAQQPDFLISFYGSQQQRSSQRTIERTDYWGDRGRYSYYDDPRLDGRHRWGYPPAQRSGNYSRTVETQVIEYKEGTLVIDFVDAQSKQLVWQATLQGVVDEQDPMGQLDKAVTKALHAFPPQQ
jgi:hypothetical protein